MPDEDLYKPHSKIAAAHMEIPISEVDEKIPTEEEVRDLLLKVKEEYGKYFAAAVLAGDGTSQEATLLHWITIKAQLIAEEEGFAVPSEFDIRRKTVCWINFGCNLPGELSGKQPAVIFRVTGKGSTMVFAAPLLHDAPPDPLLKTGAYVQIRKIIGDFAVPSGWVNVLDIQTYSTLRVDFTAQKGFITSAAMEELTAAVGRSGVAERPSNIDGDDLPAASAIAPTAELHTESVLTEFNQTLDRFVDATVPIPKRRKVAAAHLNWLIMKLKLIQNPSSSKHGLRRGNVCWVNLGANVGQEFGKSHPAVVLRANETSLIVAPLSSQIPSADKVAQGIYVRVPTVRGAFENRERWANVFRVRSIGADRLNLSIVGDVEGTILDEIDKALRSKGVGPKILGG